MPRINNQQGGYQGFSVVTRDLEDVIGPPPEIFNLTQTATAINEGLPVTFVVNTENVIAGTALYWKLADNSTASAADFSGAVSGTVTVSSRTASVTLTSVIDTSTEGNQTFTVEFYKDAAYTNLAVASAPVTIVDVVFGEEVFSANAAVQTWTVPPGVTSISVIAVGGGGGGAVEGESTSGSTTRYAGAGAGGGGALAYTNNLAVTPGQVFKFVAGPGGAGAATYSQQAGNGTASYFAYENNTVIMTAGGGVGGYGNPLSTVMNYNAAGGPGGVRSGGSGGGNGGAGGWSNMSLQPRVRGGGGGGAGGYYRSDNPYPTGGDGFWQPQWDLVRRSSGAADPSLGGGGGGGGSYANGGGVGIYGQAGGGGAGTTDANGVGTAGTPGSLLFGQAYGGGAGANRGAGGAGAVRIMWPGEHRQFPTTNTYPTEQTYGVSTSTNYLVEGYAINFTVNTSNVVSGTTLYWKFAANSTASAADFTDNATSGTITVSGNTASFTLTPQRDLDQGQKVFIIEIYKNFDFSDLLTITDPVTLDDAAYGEAALTMNATEQTWTVPNGVSSISVLAVGGGGGGAMWGQSGALWAAGGPGGGGALAYKNNIPVTPGQVFKYRIGPGGTGASAVGVNGSAGLSSYFAYENNTVIMTAGGGIGGQGKPLSNSTALGVFNAVFTADGGAGGTRTGGDGGGNGGAGGSLNMIYGQGISGYDGSRRGGGAGGAGGYAGNGGNGQMAGASSTSATAGSGGGGGGGSGGNTTSPTTGRGGGVAIYGQGTSGAAGAGSSSTGGTGSAGHSTAVLNTPYGAGAGAAAQSSGTPSNGGDGAIRIIWPGNYRTFPSTNVYPDSESYAVTPSSNTAVEGTSITFTVTTANVAANTVLYWNLAANSTASAADFTSNTTGTVTINSSGVGTFSLTPRNESASESNETFSVELYKTVFGSYQELAAVSSPVTIIDTQPTVFPTGGTDRQLFTTTGLNTWTVPSTWTSPGYIVVALRGAGGGGATTYGDGPGGPGGGGGALVLGKMAAVPGQTLYINVGQAVYNANGTSSWINTTAATPPTNMLQGYLAAGGGGGGYRHGGGTIAGTIVGTSVYPGRSGGVNSGGSGGGGGAAGTAAYNYLNLGAGGNASAFSYGSGGGGGGSRRDGSDAQPGVGFYGGNGYYNENGGNPGESTDNSGAGGGGGFNQSGFAARRQGGNGGPSTSPGDPNAEYAGGGGGGGARSTSTESGGSGGAGGKYGGGGGGAAARMGQGGGFVGSPGMGGDGMVLLVYYSA